MNKRILLYFLMLGVPFNSLLSQSILSADRYWDHGSMPPNIEWTDDDNWDGDIPPATIDDTFINNNNSANISSGNNITVESIALGADGDTGGNPFLVPPVMYINTSGNLTIADGATLTTTKGGHEGSNGVRIEGVSGNESSLIIDGTFNILSDASGDGLDINQYTSVTVGTTGILNITAKGAHGIEISDDLTNSGTIEISASSSCGDGIHFSSVVSGGAIINNNSAGTITISGGGFIDHGIDLNNDVTFNNHGTVTVSNVQDNILQGEVNFNNYGTFAGDGIINAKNFNADPSGTMSPGTSGTPVGKFTFLNSIDLTSVDLDIDITGASSYDQLEISSGTITISGADLNLSGMYPPAASNIFTIINNVAGNPIVGIFNGLPEGSLIPFNGANLELSYNIGGSNNVTLTFLGPLPVELISFNGYAEERTNVLKWQTASEENTMVFIVERSVDGTTDFEEIDRINAVGNSITLQSYEAEDFNPVSSAYYRLRIVDFDGTFEFSEIIAVERTKAEIYLVEVFPIPAEEEVTVLIHTQNKSKAIMILSDFMGRKIKEVKIELKAGINRYTLNWEEHETNFYYLTIDNGKEKVAKKILRASRD